MEFEVDEGKENKAETAEELFKRGIEHLTEKESVKALSCFERSYAIKETAECQSYLGFCIAVERGELKKGITLCMDAVSKEPENPIIYLNLGKLLLKHSRKKQAIETVRKGLEFKENDEAVEWLKDLGVRRKPLFHFLPRGHLLNKYIGILLSRFGVKGPQNPLCKF